MRRKIQAGAGVENLRLRCPYFYDVAVLLRGIDRAPAVDDLVNATFRLRYKVRSWRLMRMRAIFTMRRARRANRWSSGMPCPPDQKHPPHMPW